MTGWYQGRVEKHIHKQGDAVCCRLPVRIHRKEIRKLFDEHAVAIERNILVDATLKNAPPAPGSRIVARSTQIANGPLGDINALNVGLVEQILIPMLSNDADPYSLQRRLVRKAPIGI